MVSVKPVGVFGRFWAVAYLRTGASPNEVSFMRGIIKTKKIKATFLG